MQTTIPTENANGLTVPSCVEQVSAHGKRHTRHSLRVDVDALALISEYDYDLSNPAFQEVLRRVAELPTFRKTSEVWLYCQEHSLAKEDYVAAPLETVSGWKDKHDGGLWQTILIYRGRLQLRWESFLERGRTVPAPEPPAVAPRYVNEVATLERDAANRAKARGILEGLRRERDVKIDAKKILAGLVFVVTGNFPCLSRRDVIRRIEDAGGRYTLAVSVKTDFVIVGTDPTDKLEQARNKRRPRISLGDLDRMIAA